MKLTITYKNGNEITQNVHYIHMESEKLYFTVKRNPMPMVQLPVEVPLANVLKFDVTAED